MTFRHTVKQITLSALRLFAPDLSGRASILMYHSVGENARFFTVQPDAFERQLQYIKERGLTTLKLSELIGRLERGEDVSNCVVLTFDDGYKDNYTNAFPLLKKYEMPATIFVITGSIGNTRAKSDGSQFDMLSGSEMHEMYLSGLVEFMPHSVSHKKFTELPDNEAQGELDQSRAVLEGMLNSEADIFAFPFGAYNDAHVSFLKENGWKGAVTVREGLVDTGSDVYRLPRNAVDSATSFGEFKAKLSRAIEIFGRLKQ